MTTTTSPAAPRQLSDLPGPRGLPLFGNMLQVRLNRIHQDVEQWARVHGPTFRLRFGPRRFLVLSDHSLVASVLKERPDVFRRTSAVVKTGIEMGLPPGLFGAEGRAWRDQRRMVMASFSPHNVRNYFPKLLKVTERLHGRWSRAARAGESIPLQADLMRYTVDGVAGLAFGTDMNTLESDDEVIQRHLDKIFPTLFRRIFSLIPYWRLFRLPADRQLDRSVIALNEAIATFIANARDRMKANPSLRENPTNLLEAMIAAADLGDSGVGDAQVAGNVLTMLLAGEDTTANTLAWLIYLLHRHPEALARATEEVQRVVPDLAAMTPERIAELDYLDACASETMRLKPVAPFLAFEALQDTLVGDIAVPAGGTVWCVLRHDSVEEHYFPDPLAFKPERWLGGGEAHGAATSSKRVAMPFGAGPRICPGRYLALLEIKMAMAMLLSRFEIESVTTPDGSEPREHMAFAMSPVGLQLRLREKLPSPSA